MSAICWVLWTHICLIGFIYTHTNIFINTENISNNDKHTLPHEEGEDERGGCGCRDGGVSGSLTLLILCIAAHTHAAIQLYILNLNTHCPKVCECMCVSVCVCVCVCVSQSV